MSSDMTLERHESENKQISLVLKREMLGPEKVPAWKMVFQGLSNGDSTPVDFVVDTKNNMCSNKITGTDKPCTYTVVDGKTYLEQCGLNLVDFYGKVYDKDKTFCKSLQFNYSNQQKNLQITGCSGMTKLKISADAASQFYNVTTSNLNGLCGQYSKSESSSVWKKID